MAPSIVAPSTMLRPLFILNSTIASDLSDSLHHLIFGCLPKQDNAQS